MKRALTLTLGLVLLAIAASSPDIALATRQDELRAVGDDADGWDLSDDEWAELDESIAEADRGELISADFVLAELRALK